MDKKEKKNVPDKNKEQKDIPANKDGKKEELKELVKSIIGDELSEWKQNMEQRVSAEREDAVKLASLPAEERARLEMEKKQKDFETERQQYVSERAEFEAAKELASQGLPVVFASMVADADKDKLLDNISVFKAEYLKAIEAGLSERLKGKTPSISRETPEAKDPFLNGLGM